MRWKNKEPRNLAKWHKWFAWHPVVTDGETVWLETVERRLVFSMYDIWPEYRNAS